MDPNIKINILLTTLHTAVFDLKLAKMSPILFSYLQMKHILFARENTACKHEKTTKLIQKILLENPGNIFARQSAEKWKVTVDLAIQSVNETDFFPPTKFRCS